MNLIIDIITLIKICGYFKELPKKSNNIKNVLKIYYWINVKS
jgi:hypothetical protein